MMMAECFECGTRFDLDEYPVNEERCPNCLAPHMLIWNKLWQENIRSLFEKSLNSIECICDEELETDDEELLELTMLEINDLLEDLSGNCVGDRGDFIECCAKIFASMDTNNLDFRDFFDELHNKYNFLTANSNKSSQEMIPDIRKLLQDVNDLLLRLINTSYSNIEYFDAAIKRKWDENKLLYR